MSDFLSRATLRLCDSGWRLCDYKRRATLRLWRLSLALATLVQPPGLSEKLGGFITHPLGADGSVSPLVDHVPPVEAVKLPEMVPPVIW